MIDGNKLYLVPAVSSVIGIGQSIGYGSLAIVSVAQIALDKLKETYYLKKKNQDIAKIFEVQSRLTINMKILSNRVYLFVLALGTIIYVGGLFKYYDIKREEKIKKIMKEVLDDGELSRKNLERLRQAANIGSAEANFYLSRFYATGSTDYLPKEEAVERCHKSYLSHLTLAAQADYLPALDGLSAYYDAKSFNNPQKVEAQSQFEEYQRLAKRAALLGNQEVCYALHRNSNHSEFWLAKSGIFGEAHTHNRILFSSMSSSEEKEKSLAGLKKLDDKHSFGLAQMFLGNYYFETLKDHKIGLLYYVKASLHDDLFGPSIFSATAKLKRMLLDDRYGSIFIQIVRSFTDIIKTGETRGVKLRALNQLLSVYEIVKVNNQAQANAIRKELHALSQTEELVRQHYSDGQRLASVN